MKINPKVTGSALEGLGIIFLVLLIGEILSRWLNLPLPGNLTGLLLLFLALVLRLIKLDQVEATAKLLLDNLMLFFIPINVGMLFNLDILADNWVILLVSVVVSTLAAMAVTAGVVQASERRQQHVD